MNSSTRLPYIPGLDGIRALAVLAVLCYHANYSWALGGFLAVEEQFYLLWPFMLLFLLRQLNNNRSRLLGAIFLMIAISSGCMAVLYSPFVEPLRVYYGTDTRAAGFLAGAMLAILWVPWKAFHASRKRKLEVLSWSGLVALLVLYNYLNEFQPFLYRGGILLSALASALLIMGASSPITSLSKLFESRILLWIGTRSYSIYLWHWPVFMLSRPGIDIHLPALPVRIGQLVVTFILAELSYRWI